MKRMNKGMFANANMRVWKEMHLSPSSRQLYIFRNLFWMPGYVNKLYLLRWLCDHSPWAHTHIPPPFYHNTTSTHYFDNMVKSVIGRFHQVWLLTLYFLLLEFGQLMVKFQTSEVKVWGCRCFPAAPIEGQGRWIVTSASEKALQ